MHKHAFDLATCHSQKASCSHRLHHIPSNIHCFQDSRDPDYDKEGARPVYAYERHPCASPQLWDLPSVSRRRVVIVRSFKCKGRLKSAAGAG